MKRTTRHFRNGVLVRVAIDGVEQSLDSVEPPLPGAMAMARNAVGAIGQAIKHGTKRVSDEEFERRTAICSGNPAAGIPACDFYRKSDNRCSECGCRLKYKPRLEAWHCPIEKW